jgi:hypothetical protein
MVLVAATASVSIARYRSTSFLPNGAKAEPYRRPIAGGRLQAIFQATSLSTAA